MLSISNLFFLGLAGVSGSAFISLDLIGGCDDCKAFVSWALKDFHLFGRLFLSLDGVIFLRWKTHSRGLEW